MVIVVKKRNKKRESRTDQKINTTNYTFEYEV
jgi:hypothetical protein